MKKHLHNSLRALFLSLAVLLSLPMLAERVEINGINYDLVAENKEAAVISKSSDKYSGEVVIPESVEHQGTTYSVTSIGDNAFWGCNIISVSIPNSVVNIGECAFMGCNELKAVYISDLAAWCHIDFKDFYANPLYYAQHLYLNGEEIKELVIPEGTERIGSYAFKECIGLTSIDIPEGVTEIGEDAFEYCSSLTSATLPTTVTSIGEFAFNGCENLTAVYISDIVNWCNIKFDNFYSNPLSYAHKLYLYGELVAELILPGNAQLTSIGNNAFAGCQSLKTITIPEGVNSIGEYAFYHCSKLTSVTLPEGVTNIGKAAFGRCLSLKTINIPEGVESIEGSTFLECSSLPVITLPSTLTEIGDGAFQLCKGLRDVYCLAGKAPSCEGAVFGDYPLYLPENITLHVSAASIDSYKATAPWSSFGNIIGLKPEVILPSEVIIIDGQTSSFSVENDTKLASLQYTRTLPNLTWNSLFVPFEIEVTETFLQNYDVAYFNNIHAYDKDGNGVIDAMDMEVILIKEGTLHANHPYFIRAKNEEAKEMNLELGAATLYSTVEAKRTCITTSSAYMEFQLAGVYDQMAGADGVYAINTEGAWSPIADDATLNPFRLFLKMTERSGSPVKVEQQALSRVSIRVAGDSSETGIDEVKTGNGEQNADIYDLSGRRVASPQRGAIYLVKGKKIVR